MAERGKDFASLISSNSVFLALVLTLGAAWLNREAPLQGARPGTDKSQVAVVQKDKVAVRLWDDPLKAVSQSPEARKTQATPSSDGGAPRAVASD